jgi:lipid A 3-O-deacylase
MRLKLFFFFIFLIAGGTAFGQTYKNEFGFKSDNDAYLFYGQDRYYTNGLFIHFRYAADQQKLGEKLEKLTYDFSVGQKMYNPISGNVSNPDKQDRPFAGYLYAGGKVNFFYKKERVLKLGAEFGIVGPDALGKETQELLHQIVGFYEIKGWDYQIRNNIAVNFSAQYLQLLHRSANNKLDFSLESELNLGTTFSNAGVGVLFRAGKINQLFNSAATNSIISNNAKTEKLTRNEFFFYAKPQLNVIAYDATLQGSMFKNDSPITFEPKSVVFAQQVGFDYSTPRFTIDYSLTFKSKEVKSTALAHQYGTIAMYYRFGAGR